MLSAPAGSRMRSHWDTRIRSATTGAATVEKASPRRVTSSPTAVTTASTHEASMTMLGPESSVPAVLTDSMPMTAECAATAVR